MEMKRESFTASSQAEARANAQDLIESWENGEKLISRAYSADTADRHTITVCYSAPATKQALRALRKQEAWE